jgi:hypothetical protein
MTEADHRAGADLAYLSQLTRDDGRVLRASSIGLMTAGTVFGLMMLRTYLMSTGRLEWPTSLQRWIPLDAILLFVVVLSISFVASRRSRERSLPAANATSRALWAAWAGLGIGYLVTQVAFQLAGIPAFAVMALFAFWGGGWLVTWAIYRRGWLLLVAAACYATVPMLSLLREAPERTLLLSAAFFGLVALPGYGVYRRLSTRD